MITRSALRFAASWRASSLLRISTAAVAIVMAISLLGGCQQRSPGIELHVGFDVSVSHDRAEREALCGLLDEVVARCLRDGSSLNLWTFDRSARKVFSGSVQGPEDLHPIEDELILPVSTPTTQGTYLAPVLEEMGRTVARVDARTDRVGVLLLTDGEDWDRARTGKLVTELAGNPTVSAVWIAGVLTDDKSTFRSETERVFAPFGDRLTVSGTYDFKQGLDRFQARLKGGK